MVFKVASLPSGGVLAGTSEGGLWRLQLEGRSAFIRGEMNEDGKLNMADPISILMYLFAHARGPGCLEAGNANADRRIDIADAVSFLSCLFAQGAAPPAPFPECGAPPGGFSVGCVRYDPCAR